jgi:hypothetical protein
MSLWATVVCMGVSYVWGVETGRKHPEDPWGHLYRTLLKAKDAICNDFKGKPAPATPVTATTTT